MIDVGAHLGEYGLELRREGCRGCTISVEPIKSSYSALAERTGGDSLWHRVNAALGSSEGEISINVAGDLVSSSILPMTATHSDAMPPSMFAVRRRCLSVDWTTWPMSTVFWNGSSP